MAQRNRAVRTRPLNGPLDQPRGRLYFLSKLIHLEANRNQERHIQSPPLQAPPRSLKGKRFPTEKPGNPLKLEDLKARESGGPFLLKIYIKRIAGKHRRSILLRFGLVTFNNHFRKTPTTLIFMVSDLVDVTLTPKTNIIYLWRHQDIKKNKNKPKSFLKTTNFGNMITAKLDL